MKSLVVDDSRMMRVILRRMLAELGYEVAEAGHGKEALELVNAASEKFNLVLADWNMPEMNGFELLKELRSRAELSEMKIVMVTTEAEIGHMSSALEAGANEYIMKPFTKEIVVDKLELINALPQVGV